MKLIFLGPPGVGKGTMAEKVKDLLSIPHVSTGQLFRKNVSDETELGLKVKSILEQGNLVPDEVTVAMVEDRLARPDASGGFILDGFPRTIVQAEALEKITAIDHVINLDCNEEELIRRLTGRRFCPTCNRTFSITAFAARPSACTLEGFPTRSIAASIAARASGLSGAVAFQSR